ncbi:MAG: nucleotidyltransferase family protein [Hyphomicrobium sp.]|nr:nucleotidyltransferase family protein [Hyphomicrobium sp.]
MHIAALVLAAGRSRRFGPGNKLLADLEGAPVLAHTLAAVTAAGFEQTLVVTGQDHAAVKNILQRFRVQIVGCADAEEGMGTSIAAGVAVLAPIIDGVAIIPGDMPLLTPQTLQILLQTFAAHAGHSIVYAADRDGAQRNPVVWPCAYMPQLAALKGDRGAKSLIGAEAIAVRISDANELLDVDNPADLVKAGNIIHARHAQS